MDTFLVTFGLALVVLVQSQSKFHLTPNIASVEQQNIQAGQTIWGLRNLKKKIGLPNPFTLSIEAKQEASNGLQRHKLRLKYKKVPIRIVRIQASYDPKRKIYTGAVSGFYPQNFPANFDVSPKRTEEELKTTLVNYMNANDNIPPFVVGGLTTSSLENFKAEKQIDIDVISGDRTLVYFVRCTIDIADNTGGAYIRYPRVLIGVSNLNVIKYSLNVLKDSGNKGRSCPNVQGGNIANPGNSYGPGRHGMCLSAKTIGSTCKYSNNNAVVLTAKNKFDRSSAEVVSFNCNLGPQDGSNGAFSPSSDVFYYSRIFFTVMKEWGGLERYCETPLKLYVHFGDGYPNSFFDGEAVTFGDGSNTFFPLSLSEVIGHEMCHSITDGLGTLQMSEESLAVNEAFADFCGKALSVYETGQNDWTFAKSLVKPGNGGALRYFDNPPLDGLSIDNLDDFNTNLDLYSTMGIYLKSMYKIVDEQHVNYREAFQAFAFANQIYWNEESSLIDAACGVLRAASDLALDTDGFERAFQQVGINLDFCSLTGTQDVIIASKGAHIIQRRPTVSKFKNPVYVVRPCSTYNYLRVTVKSNGDHQIRIFATVNGNYQEFEQNSVSIPLGTNGFEIGLKSDSQAEVGVSIIFSFYW